MNFRLRQERNAFVFLLVVATPLVLLTAPLPYLLTKPEARVARAGAKLDCRIDRQELAAARHARELRCLPRERPSGARS